MKAVLMLINSDSSEEAELIADKLLEKKLAAAIQIIGPISSRYRWKDKIHKKREWMILIKTSNNREKKIKTVIRKLHSYALPGIMKLGIAGGESKYLQWILNQSTADD